MVFDKNNQVIKQCNNGMEFEMVNKNTEALKCFMAAWNISETNVEKFTAAHYVARQQRSVEGKLQWDKRALEYALKIENADIKGTLPSLYLNIAKCYEDLKNLENAAKNYQLAQSNIHHLPANGYGRMIRFGIENGLKRLELIKAKS